MKIINSIIGILIILLGSLFMNITVEDEAFRTIMYKVIGGLILFLGILYLKKLRSLENNNCISLHNSIFKMFPNQSLGGIKKSKPYVKRRLAL